MRTVCRLADIADPGAKGFDIDTPAGRRAAFLVRRGGEVYAYLNVCPHAGNRLDWKPDAFLTRDRSLIICSSHGAVFDIPTGRCVGGPCPGRELRRLPVELEGGEVKVQAWAGTEPGTEPGTVPRGDCPQGRSGG